MGLLVLLSGLYGLWRQWMLRLSSLPCIKMRKKGVRGLCNRVRLFNGVETYRGEFTLLFKHLRMPVASKLKKMVWPLDK